MFFHVFSLLSIQKVISPILKIQGMHQIIITVNIKALLFFGAQAFSFAVFYNYNMTDTQRQIF